MVFVFTGPPTSTVGAIVSTVKFLALSEKTTSAVAGNVRNAELLPVSIILPVREAVSE